MKLNCDLGESYGQWQLGMDKKAMPLLDQANIACGFHAGDPMVIYRTLELAKHHNVMIGAHPSYPDLVGFGRRSMACSDDEIYAFMHYQISAIDGMAKTLNQSVQYVKPHGALYNDMMKNSHTMAVIIKAIANYHKPLRLMIQSTADLNEHKILAKKYGVNIWAEAFADRRYNDDGRLLARTESGATLNQAQTLQQVKQLLDTGTVTSNSGRFINIDADSICVHGDNSAAISALAQIRELLDK